LKFLFKQNCCAAWCISTYKIGIKEKNRNFFSNKIVVLLDKDKEEERNRYKGQNRYFLSNKIVVLLGAMALTKSV
jgi:hypothetical protein